MQIILASAKIMNDRTTVKVPYTSVPVFEKDAERSAMELAQIPVDELSKVLHCSHAIALENHNRYQSFLNEDEKQPAVLAYFGQAYKYLEAKDFSNDDFDFAQKHLHILSFLYGMLRPLDTINPYRLEGKVRLNVNGGKTMFLTWKDKLTELLIEQVKADDGILIHLATEEFEHLFDWKRVEREVRVIKPLFLVDKGLEYKIVSMYAKGCRGAMTRFIIKNRLTGAEDLKDFSIDGFEYQSNMGDENHPHFIKR